MTSHATTSGSLRARARARWASWSRLKKTIAVALAGLVATALVAAAVLMLRAPITGSTDVQGTPAFEWSTSGPDAPVVSGLSTDGVNCTAAVNGQGSLAVNITAAFPGSQCDVSATLITSSGQPIAVQNLVYATSAVTSSFVTGCGATLAVSDGGERVKMRFTVKAGMAAGNYPAGADAGALGVFASSYNDASCPRPTP